MNWTTIVNTALTLILCGLGWVIRRGWIKYERALLAAERARADAERLRREMVERELGQVQIAVRTVTAAVARVTHDHELLKEYLGKWAVKFTADIGNHLKLSQKDVEELKGALGGMASFLGANKTSGKTAVKEIAKDTFLVHKKKEGG